MEREIMKKLSEWKDKKNRKPLMISGVRQCGKTFVMQEFGKKEFSHTAYINFEKDPAASEIFKYDYDVQRIIRELGTLSVEDKIIPGETLLIFDEIQECPEAITSLKYFCEDMPQLHLVCAGSLLGVALKKENIAFPVGKINRLKMYPMNFQEFVSADGGKKYIDALNEYDTEREIPERMAMQMEKYLKNYYIVGGMPEVVQEWCENHNYDSVSEMQDTILDDYRNDFAKHAPIHEVPKINMVWDSVPKQLAKENNKFIFSHVKEGKRSADLEDALEWLADAGLTYKVEKVESPELPLEYCADATYFKVYMSDVGLLRRKSGVHHKVILDGNEQYARFKGALAENYVLTEFMAGGIRPYFWRSGNSAEVDFLIEEEDHIAPVEVKAADNTQAKSFKLFCSRYKSPVGYKCSLKPYGRFMDKETLVFNIPLWLIFRNFRIK